MTQHDVAVVGAGIVGLAHAWRAAVRGLKVVLLERSPIACGASIRNFGMVWPIGQPPGPLFDTAMRSRELWLETAKGSGLWLNECGSLHLAHRADELAVLEEFRDAARGTNIAVELLTPEQTRNRTAAAKPDDLLGSMWSSTECCVNPEQAIYRLPAWLHEQHGVECCFGANVIAAEDGVLSASDGRSWQADRTVICSGHDFQTLFPEAFHNSGLRICKLQMLRTVAQRDGWKLGPHVASGLTLRHYTSFAGCPSLAALKRRVAEETPELDRFGIHVMMSQNQHGQVVLGDSHEYDDRISIFDRSEIDELMLRELGKQFVLPDWTIERRWHGIYAKHPEQPIFTAEPHPGVTVRVAPGGAGMTMSFGLAEQFWQDQA
ncbi:MAG: TIGR03364 family FAD-dependent oxidoreductase [Planctomycetaceae bacterium]